MEVIEKNGEEALDQTVSVATATEEAVKAIEETREKVLKVQIVKDDAESITQVEIQRDSLKNDTEDSSQNAVTTKKWKGETKAMDVKVTDQTSYREELSPQLRYREYYL